jgi:hypothetical protein
VAWSTGDYWAENVTIRRANIQGMKAAICCSTNTPGTFRIQDSYFRTYLHAISVETLATPGTRSDMPPRRMEIWNSRFDPWPGQPLQTIEMNWRTDRDNTSTTQTDQVFVYGYQGNPNVNFQVFYPEQATQSVAGGFATCTDTTTRPEVAGITCATGAVPPPLPPTPPPSCLPNAPWGLNASVAGHQVGLSWAAPSSGVAPVGYLIEAGAAAGTADLAQLPLMGAATAFGTMAPQGRYFVRVRAGTACGLSAPSNEILVDVPSGCGPLGAPPGFGFTRAGRVVTLEWAAPAGNVARYVAEVGSAPGLSNIVVADLGGATTITTQAPPGTYYVRLRAINGCGVAGAASSEIVVVVP